MSALRLPNGDDYPDAAHKHLRDAEVLLGQGRYDGAAYLSGYVVECALKSLYLLEVGKGLRSHSFARLLDQVNAVARVAGARAGRYLGQATTRILQSAIVSWTPEMRYRAPSTSPQDARQWHTCARDVFQETVHKMQLDGVL